VASEQEKVVGRYARRDDVRRYGILLPANWQMVLERQRAMLRLFGRLGIRDASELTVVEVGAGSGNNLLDLIRFGFSPEKLTGIELLADRVAAAGKKLPASVRLIQGDASVVPIAPDR
jgi:SAM-dependent methyltransferase